MEVEDESGSVYSTQNSVDPSRINLYRRGPYFCEVHWLDIRLATAEGDTAALNGDLALYCYPEKMLAEIRWHGTKDFPDSFGVGRPVGLCADVCEIALPGRVCFRSLLGRRL